MGFPYNGEESSVTTLVPGTSIVTPVGEKFQYSNVSDAELKFLCIVMPPWPGESGVTFIEGYWQPTV